MINILIVEDDELNQRMLEIMLSGKGYSIQFASNGLEAMEVVKSGKFDLIFMDLMMPLMDGFETCRRIREWEAGKSHVPIVALTAYTMQREAQKCFEVGMDEYLSKPLQVNRVFQLIEFLVSKKKKQTAPLIAPPVKKEQVEVRILDTERALPIFGNDLALYKELFGEFIHSLPEKLSQLREELNNDDLKALSLHAHNLKGLSANFGAMQLSELAGTLDMQCKDGQRELATDTLLNLSVSMDELRSKAFDVLEQMKKSPQEI
jgi:two-component system, sensor histidine kinase and response regulator